MTEKLKKSLLYIIGGVATAIGILFMILLIVLNTSKVSIGKEYKYSLSDFGSDYKISAIFIFEDEKTVTAKAYVGTEFNTNTSSYHISDDGILYGENVSDGTWEKVGKINAYEIVVSTTNTDGSIIEMHYNCQSAKTAKILYIVFMLIGFAGGVGCVVTQYLLNKRKKPLINVVEEENVKA